MTLEQISNTALLLAASRAGVTDGSAAAAGVIGQIISSTVSTPAGFTTTATYEAVTSVSLTAGAWDIVGFLTFLGNGATITATANSIGVIGATTASATGTTEGGGDIGYVSQTYNAASGKSSLMLHKIVNISATTSYFLNAQATYTVGAVQRVGSLFARRVR